MHAWCDTWRPTQSVDQVAFCNAPAFFAAVNSLISAERSKCRIGNAYDGQPCSTVRAFDVIDDNQSDTVPTFYYLLADGTTAQYSITNQQTLTAANKTYQQIDNASDELLLSAYILLPWVAQHGRSRTSPIPTTTSSQLPSLLMRSRPCTSRPGPWPRCPPWTLM